MDFSGRTILLGVAGGVAAYKACDIIRELYRRGVERVLVAMSESASQFISPLTLQALSKQPVISDHLAVDETGVPYHIAFAQQADAFLIIPATANTIAKLANGLADDMLSTTAISWTGKPLLIAPAMNTRMWDNPLVQNNIRTLSNLPNVSVIHPSEGLLACGETGQGHLADMETILHALYQAVHPHANLYAGKHVVVTAGGTQANIDPVRVISNRSSGKMGVAFAQEAEAMGAQVTLLVTPTVSPELYAGLNARVEPVSTVADMRKGLHRVLPEANMLIMTAAVSDFEPLNSSNTKIKREKQTEMVLNLKATPDLLKEMVFDYPELYTLGFAAESSDNIDEARSKRQRKGIDALCLNDISRGDIGFGAEQNEVTLLTSTLEERLSKAPKWGIARDVLLALAGQVSQKRQYVLEGSLF